MQILVALGSLFLIHMMALIIPGPNVLVVTQIAVSNNRQKGVFVSIGLATGAAIWSIAALVGLNVIFEYVAELYSAFRMLGGAYLIYIGIKIWRAASQEITPSQHVPNRLLTNWQSYRLGLFTTLTNPKAGIFFSSIFAAILPPELPLWVKLAAIGLVVADSAIFHLSLALFFSTQRIKKIYGFIKQPVDKLAGAVLAILGLHIFFSKNYE